MAERAEIGVIGGSGFYELLADAAEIEVETPYGPPSDSLAIGLVEGRWTAFVARHGKDHRLPPHRINYRANLWALRSLGVRQVLAPCAVGALRQELERGAIVLPDQLVDRTSGRPQTFNELGAMHVPFADPYCQDGRAAVLKAAALRGSQVQDGGTMVVVEGPRFSTRAESQWFAAAGWSLVNMTGHPEAVLARELAMCYTALALVTDHDAGLGAQESVDQESVFRTFAENTERMRELVIQAIGELPRERRCPCASALDGLTSPFDFQ